MPKIYSGDLTKMFDISGKKAVIIGGAGDACLEVLAAKGLLADVLQIGIPDRFIQQGDNLHLYQECGMDEESILNKIEERLKRVE